MSKSLVGTKTMDKLASLGLNSYERKLYVTLLSKGVSSAGSLSESSTVPRSRCYDVLESLREKGFVVVQNTKPIKYVSVKPSEALEKLKGVYKERYEESLERIEEMKSSDSLRDLDSMFTDGVGGVSPAELSGSIKGRHQASQHMESAIRRSSESLKILTSSRGLEDLATSHSRHLKAASGRGVRIQIAAPVTEGSEAHAESLSAFAEVRHADVKGRIMLVDGSEMLMALNDDDTHPSDDMHFWTQSEHVSSEIGSPMFDSVWNSAE